jgi:serine/threonine protein kinase
MTITVGTRFDRYDILSTLGRGGMGEVYLASDARLGRKIALKLLPAEFTDDTQRLRRFEQEARAASALNHPNIITIYEIGESNGVHFIATEFIDGQTLREKLNQGKLSINESLEIARQITSALVEAHQVGVVHRDIKPENIMIRPDGLVKVLDFGLAKLAHSTTPSNPDAETLVKSMTKPGTILGTLHYMSPEQVRGMPLDARSDIFSLGIVIYEMLGGNDPFDKPTQSDVIAAILTEDPPLLVNVPSELQRILAKALKKDKEERYQTSKDLLIDIKSLTKEIEFEAKRDSVTAPLKQYQTDSTKTSQITSIATARRFSLVHALAILLVTVLAISAVWWFVLRDNQSVNPSSLKTVEVVSWRSTPGEVYSIGSLSPDGKVIAFNSTKVGTDNIWVKQVTSGEAVQITKDEFRNENPIWSPNGEEIAFFSMRGNQPGIWRIPYLSGSPTLITKVQDNATIPRYWSKTDKLYYEANQNLFVYDIKSGQTTQLTDFDSTKAVNANTIVISPDEERIAYITTEGEQYSIWAGERGASFKQIVNSANEIRNTVWHSDSRRILYNANVDGIFQIFVIDIYGSKPVQISFGDRDSFTLDVSEDGTKILYGSSKEESDVWGVNVEKGEEFAFATDINSELWADVSPDNKTVAFQSIKNLSQGDKLFSGAILTKQNDSVAQPIELVKNGYLPTWSPDGMQLAFIRLSGNKHNLWTVKATGGEEKQLTANEIVSVEQSILPYNRTEESNFSWSPDSSKIAYANKTGVRNIWLVFADGSSDTQLTNNDDANLSLHCPIWSSDGKRIAYSSKPNKAAADGKRIYTQSVIDIETKTSKTIYQSENFHRLLGRSQSEKELIFATVNRKGTTGLPTEVNIIKVEVVTGKEHAIAKLESAYLYNIHLSFDRKMIAFAAHRDDKDNVWIMPSNGGDAKKITNNNDSRLYFSSMSWSPDGRFIYFGKQSRFSLLSMITNFK